MTSKLCKYVPPERVDILKNACIRFTQPTVFNDPFEMSPVFAGAGTAAELGAKPDLLDKARAAYEELSEDIRSRLAFSDFLEKFVDQLNERLREQGAIDEVKQILLPQFHAQTGVLSLAERADNLLMWSHYADQHRGFVIEFDADHPFFDQREDDEDHFHHLGKVKYSAQRPTTTIGGFIGTHSLLTKSSEWEYEQEWRMLVHFPKIRHQTVAVGDDEVHLVPIPPTCVARVVLGCRMTDEKRAEIVELLTGDLRYRHVEVLQAELDNEMFALNFRSLQEHYLERGKASLQRAVRWGASQGDPEHREQWSELLGAALSDLGRALQLAPNEKDCLSMRAAVFQMLERWEEAAEDYSRAISLDPNNAVLHAMHGEACIRLGRLDEAELDFDRAVRLGMEDARPYLDAIRKSKSG